MARYHLPPEIWVRVFRACVLESYDWKWHKAADQRFGNSPYSSSPSLVWQGFHPGARNLALVCRQWAKLILSDARLKIIQVHARGEIVFDPGDTAYIDELQSALINFPGYSLQIFVWAKLTSELIRFIKSHSERIHGLTLYSGVPPSTYFTQLDCVFPQLQYFHWKIASELVMKDDSYTEALRHDSLLMEFISKHSHHLKLVWLDPGLLRPISLTEFSYSITILDLSLRKMSDLPSIDSVHTLLKFCCNLEEIFLYFRPPERNFEEPRLDFLAESSYSVTAHRLHGLTLRTEEIFLLQILSSISMPRLETLEIDGPWPNATNAKIHPDLLRIASPIHLPNLTTITIQSFCPLLADFFSIPVFRSLDKLSVSYPGPDDHIPQDHKAFQHCNDVYLLDVDGSRAFQDWMLYHLAYYNISLQSLTIDSSWYARKDTVESPTAFELAPMSLLSTIRSLTIQQEYDSHEYFPYRILGKLPGVEIFTLKMRVESLNDLDRFITPILKPYLHLDPPLPALKVLNLFLRDNRWKQPKNPIITKGRCEALSDFLHRRFDMGNGLQTLVCNYHIAPKTLASLKGCVGEVIICDRDAGRN